MACFVNCILGDFQLRSMRIASQSPFCNHECHMCGGVSAASSPALFCVPSVQRMEAEVTSVKRQHNKAHAGTNALLGALVAMYDGCKI